MPDPCPNCGPLRDDVNRLGLEVEALQRDDEAHARLLGTQHQRTQELQRHLLGDVDYWEDLGALASKALDRIRELEQALADARAKAASDSNGFKLTLDAQIRPLYEKRRELTKTLRLGGDAHQTIGEALAVVESAIDALEMVDAEVQRRHVDPEFYSAPLPAPPEGER